MGGTASHSGRGSEMKGAEETETLEEQSPQKQEERWAPGGGWSLGRGALAPW